MQTQYSTLVDLLRYRSHEQAEQIAYRFLQDGETEKTAITYQELDRQARAIAVKLKTLNPISPTAVIIYPYEAGLEFIAAFFGCLYGDVIAVPCHPPMNRHAYYDLQLRLASSQAKVILTHKSLLSKLQSQLTSPDIHWLVTDDLSLDIASNWTQPNINSDTIAFLQYTSGSTGQPKGVMITHDCIMHNQQMLKQAFGHNETSVGVGWLPLFHDMGLIGNVIQALYVGRPSIFMSPVAFIQKPIRWLQAISQYKATTSGAPNFAFDLLCRHVKSEQRSRLDLSSWDVAFSGAEPIRVETMDRFYEFFSPCGFRREAFYPCYGMAEATLLISGGQKNELPVIKYVNEAAIEENKVITSNLEKKGYRVMVSCGQAWLDEKIIIVDPHTLIPVKENQIGEIWVSGLGLGKGYWNEPEKTANTFHAYTKDTREGPFLRTGDLGFLQNKELFITGRLNDVLVFWGFNHYPQHIEETVENSHPAFRKNCNAAFSVEVEGEDRLVIVQEVERTYRQSIVIDDLIESVRWAVFDKHFVDIYAFILIKTGSIPKTSSGKIQRHLCKTKFLDGSLDTVGEWYSPPNNATDMTSILKRYFNPKTHLKRYLKLARGKIRRLFL
ncbi:AMP-binding protein [Aphanothece hegewaldii CCALA 016]|uniref:AMP-binding protein n=1 Tax=Aphanothece hegewaldii CCALA 016 TaxID=2107694 RepID=A0A2T1LUP7_9CHRO|nr:fatty acyl-AMP ligase [Aphanothece hegewaldii]PSF35289.1 AMP-binding protein [Aphanothece hegewaldii CCALA 016]